MSTESNEDLVFKALAAPIRRRILDRLKERPATTGDLCAAYPDLDRCTVMMHLKVLEESGLVVGIKRGRERWNHLNAIPIHQIHQRWIGPYAAYAAEGLSRLNAALGG